MICSCGARVLMQVLMAVQISAACTGVPSQCRPAVPSSKATQVSKEEAERCKERLPAAWVYDTQVPTVLGRAGSCVAVCIIQLQSLSARPCGRSTVRRT